MKKREKQYLKKQRILQRKISKLRQLYCSVMSPASFPDSGYYYSGKQRELERMEEEIKKLVSISKFESIHDSCMDSGEKAHYNYNVKVWENGRTAYEMDCEMCGY